MSDFVLTPAAQANVLRMIDFTEGDNPSAILRVVDALDEAMQLLAENPMLGHIRRDLAGDDIRFWPVFQIPDRVPTGYQAAAGRACLAWQA